MPDPAAQAQVPAGAPAVEVSEFDKLLEGAFKPKSAEAKTAVKTAVQALAGEALRASTLISDDAITTIEAIIAELDKKLSEQVSKIIHHEDFKAIEGTWRGLHYLVNNTETDETLKIRVPQYLQEGSGGHHQEIQGHQLRPEPVVQEDIRIRIRHARRHSVRLPAR